MRASIAVWRRTWAASFTEGYGPDASIPLLFTKQPRVMIYNIFLTPADYAESLARSRTVPEAASDDDGYIPWERERPPCFQLGGWVTLFRCLRPIFFYIVTPCPFSCFLFF